MRIANLRLHHVELWMIPLLTRRRRMSTRLSRDDKEVEGEKKVRDW